MKGSLRKILADSHVAVVAIALLLLWSLDYAFHALWGPLSRVTEFLLTALAIRGIPYSSYAADSLLSIETLLYLSWALWGFAAAWILSHWVFGVGPLHCLSDCRSTLVRRNHA